MQTLLLFGATGWIGNQLVPLLEKSNYKVIPATSRLGCHRDLIEELEKVNPQVVLNAAGLTGRPNIDWCEDHQLETLEVNVVGTALLASLCYQRSIYFIQLATGCLYQYDDAHPIGGPGHREDDPPNYCGSYYSRTKALIEEIIKVYPKTLILRFRMPISDDLHPRSFLTKISRYSKIASQPNSISVLYDLLPLIPQMLQNEETGIYNFCNPGTVTHDQLLTLYREHVDPNHSYTNITPEERDKFLVSGRSDTELDCSKLSSRYPVPDAQTSIRALFTRFRSD